MKKCFSRYRLALFVLSVMSSMTFAKVVWEGANAPDVIDQDLVIKDDTLLRLGSTTIEAIHSDVTVTLKKDITVSGHWAGESQLYLKVAAGKTITFVLDYNLTFIGSSAQAADTDLLVVQSGPGLVNVTIAEDKQFKITSKDGSGGVQMFVLMYGGETAPSDEYCTREEYCDEYCGDEYCLNGEHEVSDFRPTLRFSALDTEEYSNDNRRIVIGRHSRLSFLSSRPLEIAQDSAFIEFDPTSSSLGRMILEIKDTGAFIVAGHFTCQKNGGCITSANIDLSTPAGQEAIWSIFNSRGRHFAAGLLVLNKNQTMFELLQSSIDNINIRQSHSSDYTGDRLGVVVGANGILWTQSNAYLDYVGLALNQKSLIPSVCRKHNLDPNKVLKVRNPSALFIDGDDNPNAIPAQFLFSDTSAVFFRSGIANDGTIRDENDVDPFTIDASQHTRGVGNIVFDVEGELDAQGLSGDGALHSKIELLSLEVAPTGGSLFVDSDETNFPLRTFNTEDGELLAYNTGAFLINNRLNLFNTSLSHTDVNHHVFQDNDVLSEPTYIGGEAFKLLGTEERPSIRFFDARLLVNADIALTGVDLVVPNLVDSDGIQHKNNVDFVFFSSGSCIDNGTGRQMILGTRIGSTAADGTRIDNDAHLDVMQLFDAIGADYPITDIDNQTLHLRVSFNTADITDIEPTMGSFSINTIFLGNTSNISIGTNADSTGFNIDTNPWLRIQGNYFSFTTRGGLNGCPSTSNETGQGGIFVDLNGKLSIDPGFMASFCVLITRTRNGIVDLPAGQVFFCDDLGIINGNTDLSTMSGQILVAPGEEVGDLVLDWQILKKNCMNFSPFQPVGPCCPTVTETNVSSLPTIEGTVNNLIIRGSRLGDAATFIVNGGTVRNIEFPINNSCCIDDCQNISGQAPVATIILENNGTVVLSGEGAGAVGITIIANGSGRVDLAGDITIASQCAFVKGPDFAEGDVLTINADIAREIILPAFGTLDLRSFDLETDVVQFTGAAQFAVEPGATIITGMGTLSFANNSQLRFEAAPNVTAFFQAIPHGAHDETLPPLETIPAADVHNQYDFLTDFGADLHNTDDFRIRLMGEGVIELRDDAQAFLPFNAVVGVETSNNSNCNVTLTDLELRLLDNAQFVIGELNLSQGGVFQIGNVEDQNAVPTVRQVPHVVNFTLTINGVDAEFFIGSQGFMGLGVGIERIDGIDPLTGEIVPNEDIVNTLFNVSSITLNFLEGRFTHDRIFRGDDPNASLFAIDGDETISYNLIFDDVSEFSNFNIAGGGNMILTFPGIGGLHPIVLDQDGQVEVAPGVFDPRLWTSIMASSALQNNTLEQLGLTGLELFELLKTHDAVLEPSRPNTFGRANAASTGVTATPETTGIRIDTVSEGVIIRGNTFDIIGNVPGSETEDRQAASNTAAVFVNIDQNLNEVLTVTLIRP
jgi:hypothetical protein